MNKKKFVLLTSLVKTVKFSCTRLGILASWYERWLDRASGGAVHMLRFSPRLPTPALRPPLALVWFHTPPCYLFFQTSSLSHFPRSHGCIRPGLLTLVAISGSWECSSSIVQHRSWVLICNPRSACGRENLSMLSLWTQTKPPSPNPASFQDTPPTQSTASSIESHLYTWYIVLSLCFCLNPAPPQQSIHSLRTDSVSVLLISCAQCWNTLLQSFYSQHYSGPLR